MTISNVFTRARSKNEPALILYYPAGFPDMETSIKNIMILAEYGADIIEVGVPFSDPLADGPVLQHASARALAGGATLPAILDCVGRLALNTPLVLMSYLNPLAAMGAEALSPAAAAAGFAGMIVPDLPLEHAPSWRRTMNRHGIRMICVTAPNTTPARLKEIATVSQGFIYAVSRYGPTGSGGRTIDNTAAVAALKKMTDTPVALGFGISSPDRVRSAGRIADGVIVGSRIVQAVSRGEDLGALVRTLKAAAKTARRNH